MTTLNVVQKRELTRSENTVNYCNKNTDRYKGFKAFERKLEELIGNISSITALIPARSASGEGDTTKKRVSKADIATAVNDICSLVIPYALDIEDATLYNAVNFTTSDVVRLADVAVLGFVNTLVGVVRPLIGRPDFADYPLSNEQLEALSANAAKFNSTISDAKIIDKDSSIASANIDALLAASRLIIRKLNKLVNYLKKTQPGFVTGFRSATALVNTGIHHSGVRGIILSTTGLPVEGASVVLQGKINSKATVSKIDGGYEISKFISGKAILTITATGYDSQAVGVTIIRGKMAEFNGSLQAKVIALAATA